MYPHLRSTIQLMAPGTDTVANANHPSGDMVRTPFAWLRCLIPIGLMLIMLIGLFWMHPPPSRPPGPRSPSDSSLAHPGEGPAQNFLTDRS